MAASSPSPRKVTWESKNYRGITLTFIAAKVYNALLLNHIKPEIKKILRKNQNGFQRNRFTTLDSDYPSNPQSSTCKKCDSEQESNGDSNRKRTRLCLASRSEK